MTPTRRDFLRGSSALALSTLCAPSIIRAENLREDKVRVAIVGVGGRGWRHVEGLAYQELVAFCDVDDGRAERSYKAFPDVPRFKDFRVMLEKMDSQIDAVSICTPDHMHYAIAQWALAYGKHILVEKPLTRTFEEAMLLREAAENSKVITQMGNQGHANSGLRLIQEWVRAGIIGDIVEAYHWTNRPVWPQGMSEWKTGGNPPKGFDWNLWLGVAPEQPYRPEVAPFQWRGYRDFGCGAIGDIACHAMDASYTGLDLKFPTRIEAKVGRATNIAFPKESEIVMDFISGVSGKPVKVTWLDGGRLPQNVPFVPKDYFGTPEKPAPRGDLGPMNGSFIVGTKGTIAADMYAQSVRLFPIDYFMQLRRDGAMPEKTLPRVKGGHFKEWIDGIKTNTQPGANIADFAANFTGTTLLGAASLMTEGPLNFDVENERFIDNDDANSLLKSQYAFRKEFLPA